MLRAQYDENGNIILPDEGKKSSIQKENIESNPIEFKEVKNIDSLQWGLPDEPAEDISHLPSVERFRATQRIATQLQSVRESCTKALEEAEEEAMLIAKEVLNEGERQIRAGLGDVSVTSRDIFKELIHSVASFGSFLTQPVLVPSRKKRVKEYSRGQLFLLDIIRFGGTFAGIFALLFSAMNYQSFIVIAAARIEPILEFTRLDTDADVQRSLAEKLRHVPALPTAGDKPEGLIAHLPDVGPPENLLIIPKLNLSTPIVAPPTDSLLTENWKQLEVDIQKALESGVVHYPGTAAPGQAGNFFVTGHSSYFGWADGDYKSVFARLFELNVGDEFWVYYGGDKHRYIIENEKEIIPSDVTVLDQPTNKRIATLMTCTPVGTTLRRLILTAQEVDLVTGEPMDVGEHQKVERPDIKVEALPI